MKKTLYTYTYLICFVLIFFKSNVVIGSENEIILSKIKSYFNNLKTLEADFIQIGPSGNVSEGKFYLDLPGKLRFDYQKPNNILITCQGFWLIIQDRKTKKTNKINKTKKTHWHRCSANTMWPEARATARSRGNALF